MSWWHGQSAATRVTEATTAANSLGVAVAMYYLWLDGAGGLVPAIGAGAGMVGLLLSGGLVFDYLGARRER